MTVSVANLVSNTNTFGDWVNKTNVLADIATNQAVTVGGTPAVGNAVVNGVFQAETIFVDTISGGEIGAASSLDIVSNTTISGVVTHSGNVVYNNANTYLGTLSKFMVAGANATHYVISAYTTTQKLLFTRTIPVTETGNATVEGTLTLNNKVIPYANGLIDIGETTLPFRHLYIDAIVLNGDNLEPQLIKIYDAANTQVFP